jgi:hypothetical protein
MCSLCLNPAYGMQTQQNVKYTAGLSEPIDLTGQMSAALIAGTLALHKNGRYQGREDIVEEHMRIAYRLYNVTVDNESQGGRKRAGVVEHDRRLWQDDSFHDDRMWAVRPYSVCQCSMPVCTPLHARIYHRVPQSLFVWYTRSWVPPYLLLGQPSFVLLV